MNAEKAFLQQACEHSEQPGTGVWTALCEQLDRQQLGQKFHLQEEEPPAAAWDRIRPTNRIRFMHVAAASILFGIICGILYLQLNPLPNPLANATVKSAAEGITKIAQPAPVPSSDLRTQEPDRMDAFTDQTRSENHKRQHTRLHDDPNYLWVAAENGNPIRVPMRWSSLSCCLSGESESAECKSQQNSWHSELAGSGLGFQADPILGLMELIDGSNDQ